MIANCQRPPVVPRRGPPRVRPGAAGIRDEPPSAGVLVAGRYRLLERVGRGGTAVVWRARDELLGRDVAVKQLIPPHPDGLAEARIAARVRHPNVAAVHDLVQYGRSHWLVMDYHPAGTLAALLRGGRRLPPAVVAALGLQLLDALRAVHAAGVVHCDVKPANLLLDDGRLVLIDFGIAAAGGEHPVGRSDPDVVVGSPAYMAPEVVRGESPGPPADLWSLGVTLYTAIEGRTPFPQSDPAPTLAAVLHDPPPPARLAGPLQPLLALLLVKDPAGRPSHDTIHALLAAAHPVTSTLTTLTSPRVDADPRATDGATTRAWPAPAEHPLGAADGFAAAS
jgi:serine/threonine protein kinase